MAISDNFRSKDELIAAQEPDELNIDAVEYVRKDGGYCPRCKRDDAEGHRFEADGDGAFQPMKCGSCGYTWLDEYVLSSIFDTERDERLPGKPARVLIIMREGHISGIYSTHPGLVQVDTCNYEYNKPFNVVTDSRVDKTSHADMNIMIGRLK